MRITTHANKSARDIVKLVEKATMRELGMGDCEAIAAHVQEAINAAKPKPKTVVVVRTVHIDPHSNP